MAGHTKMIAVAVPADRQPFWAKCTSDGFIWPAQLLPMDMARAGRMLAQLRCPLCGGGPKGIMPAKQDSGELLEPMAVKP